jgi:septum formation protein
MNSKLILASASARRKKILAALGANFEVVIPKVEEVFYASDARRTAQENAAMKSAWCRARHPECYSIAADTTIEFEGRCVTKARTKDEAIAFLKMFSGRTHAVYTAVAMARPRSEPDLMVENSSVRFRSLSDDDIRSYVAKVNPMDRAGAYDIDELGETLIESFTGSRANIMGLPEEPVKAWLQQEGLTTE